MLLRFFCLLQNMREQENGYGKGRRGGRESVVRCAVPSLSPVRNVIRSRLTTRDTRAMADEARQSTLYEVERTCRWERDELDRQHVRCRPSSPDVVEGHALNALDVANCDLRFGDPRAGVAGATQHHADAGRATLAGDHQRGDTELPDKCAIEDHLRGVHDGDGVSIRRDGCHPGVQGLRYLLGRRRLGGRRRRLDRHARRGIPEVDGEGYEDANGEAGLAVLLDEPDHF